MSDEVISVEGRVVSGGREGTTIAVSLWVDDELVDRAVLAESITLALADGQTVEVVLGPRTVSSGLAERKQTGPWAKLGREPGAGRLAARAPGPHVRATLIHERLEPGARLQIRGRLLAGTSAAATRIRAEALSQAETQGRPRPTTERHAAVDGWRRWLPPTLAIVAIAAIALGYERWVVAWPDHLAHPGLTRMRVTVGLVAALQLGVWPAFVLGRPGLTIRQLPIFVGRTGEVERSSADQALGVAVVVSGLFGLITGLVALEPIAASGDVLLQGSKGPFVDASVVPLVFASVALVGGWLALWLTERRAARLAQLFRTMSGDWQLARGTLRSGTLSVQRRTSGSGRTASVSWAARARGPLFVDSDRGPLRIASEGLVWGVDTLRSEPDPNDDRTEVWPTGKGARVVVAGRLGDGSELRASGPESLLLVASHAPDDLLASLRRGVGTRRVLLAIPPLVVALTLLLV